MQQIFQRKKYLKGTPSSHHWQILFPTEPLKNSITPSRKLFPKAGGAGGRQRGGCTGIFALQRQVFSGVLIWSYSKLNCRTLSLNGEEASFITSFVFQWVCSFKVAGCECRKRHSKNEKSAKFKLLYETKK